MELLDLSINQLTREIPAEFATLTTLTRLDISYNFLSATDADLITFLNTKDPDWAAQ
ncbi:hypothetical protein [Candidatus Chloroploca asiatica]|uniref:hypothetical protein n=1 Tax=Candidatus Chloroploca asiatica TaxID=1506545 RepID=UPI0015585621|nr:hypothetical protein [Candidatus Chloroploca asiatica]